MTKNKGYIPISRALFDSQIWLEERTYSRFEAWLDLIQAVRFEDGIQYISAYKKVELHRGQMVGSIRYLAHRWGWSTKKVRNYLEYLVSEEMIALGTPKDTGITVVTLSNYDTYNPMSKVKGTAKDTAGAQQGHSRGTNIKKENKENKEPPIVPQKGKRESDVKVKKKRFVKPTLEQVDEYCLARENGITAGEFIAFYDSKGWMVGKNKMIDWEASVRTWEIKRKREELNKTEKNEVVRRGKHYG